MSGALPHVMYGLLPPSLEAEERQLREMLVLLERDYGLVRKPYVDRLCELQATRPFVLIVYPDNSDWVAALKGDGTVARKDMPNPPPAGEFGRLLT